MELTVDISKQGCAIPGSRDGKSLIGRVKVGSVAVKDDSAMNGAPARAPLFKHFTISTNGQGSRLTALREDNVDGGLDFDRHVVQQVWPVRPLPDSIQGCLLQ